MGRAICRCGVEETAAGHAWAGSAAFKESTDVVFSFDKSSRDEEGEMLRHIEAENSLDMHQHTARVAYVTQRHAFNFSLGVRLMLFVIPLALGVFGDIFLLLSTLSLLPVLWYFDGLS